MNITNIKMKFFDNERIKAQFSITFNNVLTVNFCNIIYNQQTDKMFIAFPVIKDENNEFIDLCCPTTMQYRDLIFEKIFYVYNNGMEEYNDTNSNEEIKITGLNITKTDFENQIFRFDMILNECFRINNNLMKKVDDIYYLPHILLLFTFIISARNTTFYRFSYNKIKKDYIFPLINIIL